MEKQKIFFSYSRVDADLFALKLAADLQKAGANLWVDQLNIELGKLWDEEVEKALNNADCVLFIATEKSTTSNNVLNEVYYALEENKQVIPVIATKCTLPFRLKRLQYIDFTVDYECSLHRLLIALRLEMPGSDQPVAAMTQPVIPNYQEDEEEQFWKHVLGRNNLFSFEDYLSAYPNGKYSMPASEKIKELQKSDIPKQVVQPIQIKSNSSVKDNSPANKKWLRVAIIVLVVGIVSWFLMRDKVTETTPPIQAEASNIDSIKARNERLALACTKALSAGEIDEFMKYFSADVVDYADLSTQPFKGTDLLRKNVVEMLNSYPDLTADSVRAVAEADSVSVYGHWTWTPKKDLNNIRSTGEKVSYDDTDYYKFDSQGKIISHRSTSAANDAMKELSQNKE